MIITKTEKQLYSFLKFAFDTMGKSNISSDKFLMGDEGVLYFSTYYVKGCIQITMMKNGKEVAYGSFGKDFYTLKMLDDKSFELKESTSIVEPSKVDEVRTNMIQLFERFSYVRKLEKIRTTMISTISKDTGILVPDRYLPFIKKMDDGNLYNKNDLLLLETNELDEKTSLNVVMKLVLDCTHDQPGGFNDAETRLR